MFNKVNRLVSVFIVTLFIGVQLKYLSTVELQEKLLLDGQLDMVLSYNMHLEHR